MDTLLPQAAIDVLPFAAEPFSRWNKKTDIYKFFAAIYTDNYASYSDYLFKEGKKEVKEWEKKFTSYEIREQKKLIQRHTGNQSFWSELTSSHAEAENVKAASNTEYTVASKIKTNAYPSFSEDQEYGRVAKYILAWRCCVGSLLEESGFYSLAHLLETETEIESSRLLASQGYYKQSVQVLRSFLEELIMPIHFCENEEEFNKWNANKYHTPPLRGRDGIIKRLASKGVLQTPVANAAIDLYGDLNSYIHGSENRLNYKNVHDPSSSPLTFRYEDFCMWVEYLSRSVDLGIRLLRINYLQWDAIISPKRQALKSSGKVICSSCRNETDFDSMPMTTENFDFEIPQADGTWIKADESFPGFIVYRCRRCGSTMILNNSK